MERGVKSTMMMEIEKCASLKIEEERGEQSNFKLRETMSIRSSSRYGLREGLKKRVIELCQIIYVIFLGVSPPWLGKIQF